MVFSRRTHTPPCKQKGGIPYEADDPDPKAAFGPRGAVHGAERVRTGTGRQSRMATGLRKTIRTVRPFTFKMPEGDVSLSAAYLQTYLLYEKAGKAEFL